MDLHQVKVVFKYRRIRGYHAEMVISEDDYVNMKDNPEILKVFMVEYSTGTITSPSGEEQQLLPSLILFIKERNNEEYIIHTIEMEMMAIEPILSNRHIRTDDHRVISLEFSAALRPSIIVNVPKSLQNRVLYKGKGAITKTLARRLRRFNPERKWWDLQQMCNELRFTKIVIREHYLPLNFIELNEGLVAKTISMTPKQRTYPAQQRTLGSHDFDFFCGD